MEEIAELRNTLDRLHAALDDIIVRGIRAAGPPDLAKLMALQDEFHNAGAGHIASRLKATLDAIQADQPDAAATLLRTMTAGRLFDRMLTLEVAASLLSAQEEEA